MGRVFFFFLTERVTVHCGFIRGKIWKKNIKQRAIKRVVYVMNHRLMSSWVYLVTAFNLLSTVLTVYVEKHLQ